MKRYSLLYLFLALAIALTGCGSEKQEPTATEGSEIPPTAEAAEPTVLELVGPSEARSLTMADLRALHSEEGWAGGKSSTGRITPPEIHKGVTLQDLAAEIGGLEPGQGLSVVAKDGYAMTYSYDQIANGNFITYDPGTGDETTIDADLQVILAYERNGEAISADSDGPLRIAILSPQNDQVVDGHWMVKWVTKVEIKDMAEDWMLQLEGALAEEMDRATFESCAAANCHQATWNDADGQEWTGVPLWLLAGRIDGGDKHGDEAYNDPLALQGYSLEVIAADGYSAAFDSTRFDHNDAILLAHLVDGELLSEKHFPLRLVGSDLEKGEMVGQVTQIVADLPAEQAAPPAPTVEPPPEAWTLQLEGALSEEIDWAAFVACTGCHPANWTDGDGQIWSGVPLWKLVGRVDDGNRHDSDAYDRTLAEAGYSIDLVAADGYSASLDSQRVDQDDGLLLAFQVNGEWLEEKHFPLRLVGDGLEKNEMVGQLTRISVNVPPESSEAPAPGASEQDAALVITGGVEKEQALSIDALRSMEVVEIEVEHPKKGMQRYSGVRLNELLDQAGVATGVSRVATYARDGYETHTGLEEVRACNDCLVAFEESGLLNLVMPDMESGLWVKDVIRIELQ